MTDSELIEKFSPLIEEQRFPNQLPASEIDEITVVENYQPQQGRTIGVLEISFMGNFSSRKELKAHDELTTLWLDIEINEPPFAAEQKLEILTYDLKEDRKRFPDKARFLDTIKQVISPKTYIKGEIKVIYAPAKSYMDHHGRERNSETEDKLRFVAALVNFNGNQCVGVRWHGVDKLGIPQSTARSTWMILPQDIGLNLIDFYEQNGYTFAEHNADYYRQKLLSNDPNLI
ncbi:hypothetical protein [Persicobacter psychrovividus]|uniref:Uncharacterized protein n=1 Tax=Persicobacter psychrovividus TaxID=387638 RepID=A0ABN6L4H9_9BACT|nr:hypothetical protein PEPS_00960 [Persicobacter psychrovividus]